MRIATTKGEKKIADFVDRVLEIKGARARAIEKQAETEFLRLNPHLKDLKNLPKGTPFLIPEIPGARAGKESGAAISGSRLLIEEGLREIDDLRKALSNDVEREVVELKSEIELTKLKELRTLVARQPDLRQRLTTVARGTQARIKAIEEAHEARKQHLEDLEKGLVDLLKRVS